MAIGIGSTLREARNSRKIELAEVEASTKIRVRYLLAIENEEWGALPGGIYTRGFIRSYAAYLGLDGARLADEYQRNVESPAAARTPSAEPLNTGTRQGAIARVSGPVWAAGVSLVLVALLIAIGLLSNGDGGSPAPAPVMKVGPEKQQGSQGKPYGQRPGLTVVLVAKAEIWVCLLGKEGEPLVDGRVLEAGAKEGPFNSDSFTVSLGNGEIAMRIDGRPADIPATPSPVGYEIGPKGELEELPEGERPTCA